MRSAFAVPPMLLVAALVLNASDSKMDRETLKGIKSLDVVIEDLPADAISGGLTVDQIRTDVELRLRKAGVKVLDASPGYLYVNANVMKGAPPLQNVYTYNVHIGVYQRVMVIDRSVSCFGETWATSYLGMVGSLTMVSAVRQTVADYVDQFLNAYLSVNPKQ